MKNEIESVTSTGNVFADAELPDAEVLNAKAQLSYRIMDAIKAKGITQTEFAEMAGISQPRLSVICSTRFDEVSIEAMLKVLSKAGYDVSINLKPRLESEAVYNEATCTKHNTENQPLRHARREKVMA